MFKRILLVTVTSATLAGQMLAGLLIADTASARADRVPRFTDYAVPRVYIGPPAVPVLDGPDKIAYRTRIRNAARMAPNFAGEYVLDYWGCGTSCNQIVVVSSRTGEVFMPPFSAQGGETLYRPEDSAKFERLQWRLNSRLLVINGRTGDDEKPDAYHFFEFTGRGFRHIRTIPGNPVAGTSTEQASSSTPPPANKPVESDVSYVGRWASRFAECRDPNADSVMQLEAMALTGYEHRCEFKRLERVGDMWTADGACVGEDDSWKSSIRFSVDGDTMIMRRDQGKETSLLRCP